MVGSYALMDGTGFGHTDFLQCCKFAEGDSRILSQKLSRDAFGEFTKKGASALAAWSPQEVELGKSGFIFYACHFIGRHFPHFKLSSFIELSATL
jgi:hypothetical protein